MKHLYFRSIWSISCTKHTAANTALKVHQSNWSVATSQEKGTNPCFLGMSCDSRAPTFTSPRDEELQSKARVSGYCEDCRDISQTLQGVDPWVSSLLVNFRRPCLQIEAGGEREGKGELWSKWIMLENSSWIAVVVISWLQNERLLAWMTFELEFNALLHSDYSVSCKKGRN